MKKNLLFGIVLIVIGIVQAACGILPSKTSPTAALAPTAANPPATATNLPPTPAIPPTETELPSTAVSTSSPGKCTIFANSEVTVYMRPSEDSLVYGFVPSGLEGKVQGRTEDGWIGFEPNVAQAGNVGVFRLRWVPPDSGAELSGECEKLPVIWGPPAGVCFAMFMQQANIYESPSVTSSIITTVSYEQTAEILGVLGDNWAKLDLSVGNIGIDQKGWVEKQRIVYQGPCKELPEITP